MKGLLTEHYINGSQRFRKSVQFQITNNRQQDYCCDSQNEPNVLILKPVPRRRQRTLIPSTQTRKYLGDIEIFSIIKTENEFHQVCNDVVKLECNLRIKSDHQDAVAITDAALPIKSLSECNDDLPEYYNQFYDHLAGVKNIHPRNDIHY